MFHKIMGGQLIKTLLEPCLSWAGLALVIKVSVSENHEWQTKKLNFDKTPALKGRLCFSQ
jgi:hypothetical protein